MGNSKIKMSPSAGPTTGGLHIDLEDTEAALGEAEPWEAWESKLVLYSVGFGIVALVVLGTIINMTILK